jgi:hypothetical protein
VRRGEVAVTAVDDVDADEIAAGRHRLYLVCVGHVWLYGAGELGGVIAQCLDGEGQKVVTGGW